ncbi:nuclear transport factor 2 family protein [Kutzneria kofuensis]|uniref:Ketosteroid isomerase-like protein n=1 Tax=Kutzneria kofuensis TaxID=103725 RepID=A0A7W9KP65_9PSEU|nr:nuclear transport factor 2 family protein [Kutzneria kofuensis]MBB5896173.1 ketosteroid isomerase-like protein [Kutzneria kofuensis]
MTTTQPTAPAVRDDVREIRTVIENWAVWRDAGDWTRFATVWHRDGQMTATWFHGSAADFIAASAKGFEAGVRILHFLGGSSVDVAGDRAIAQTKMTITQRATVHGVPADVVCTGRFYDFFGREDDQWRIVRRRLIYEIDRMTPVNPGARIELDAQRLARFPEGYRHLAYVQTEAGYEVRNGLPGLTGEAVERLYRDGAAWLA